MHSLQIFWSRYRSAVLHTCLHFIWNFGCSLPFLGHRYTSIGEQFIHRFSFFLPFYLELNFWSCSCHTVSALWNLPATVSYLLLITAFSVTVVLLTTCFCHCRFACVSAPAIWVVSTVFCRFCLPAIFFLRYRFLSAVFCCFCCKPAAVSCVSYRFLRLTCWIIYRYTVGFLPFAFVTFSAFSRLTTRSCRILHRSRFLPLPFLRSLSFCAFSFSTATFSGLCRFPHHSRSANRLYMTNWNSIYAVIAGGSVSSPAFLPFLHSAACAIDTAAITAVLPPFLPLPFLLLPPERLCNYHVSASGLYRITLLGFCVRFRPYSCGSAAFWILCRYLDTGGGVLPPLPPDSAVAYSALLYLRSGTTFSACYLRFCHSFC